MFGDILQPTHLLLILLVALIVLGPKRLPEVGRSLGRGLRDFRSGMQGVQDEARGIFSDALDEPSLPAADSTVSMVPEPIAPLAAEPVPVARLAAEPATASVTKVTPVEPDPAEFAD
jgi:sec-independent protein translocase protein TatA